MRRSTRWVYFDAHCPLKGGTCATVACARVAGTTFGDAYKIVNHWVRRCDVPYKPPEQGVSAVVLHAMLKESGMIYKQPKDLTLDEFADCRLILNFPRHVSAMVHGVIYDRYDPTLSDCIGVWVWDYTPPFDIWEQHYGYDAKNTAKTINPRRADDAA